MATNNACNFGSGTTSTVLHGNASGGPTYGSVVNADIAASTIDLTAKVTGTLPFANGGFGFATTTTGDIFYASGTNTPAKLAAVATGQVLISGTTPSYSANPQLTTLGLGAAVSATGITSQLNIFSATQASIRLAMTGQEYTAGGNTSADGVAFVLGINRANNKQLWIADSARLASSSTNPIFRIVIASSTTCGMSCLATDGTTGLPMGLNNNGGDITIGANIASNLIIGTATAGLQQTHAAVSAGTANSTLVTGVVLSSGASGTINNSAITTSHIGFVTVTSRSGTAGTQYVVTCGTGTFSVSGGAADNSTIAVFFIKAL